MKNKKIDKGIENNDFITWNRYMLLYEIVRTNQEKIETLEKELNDLKLWLEGFRDGFLIKQKKEK